MRPTRSSTAKANPSATPPAPVPVVGAKSAAKTKTSRTSTASKSKAPEPKLTKTVHQREEHDEQEEEDELAYFEQQRLSNIKRNQSLFSDLLVGTGGSASSILGKTGPTSTAKAKAKRSSGKRAKDDSDDDDDDDPENATRSAKKPKKSEKALYQEPVRRSSRVSLRLRGLTPSDTSDVQTTAAAPAADDDETTPALDGPILSLSDTTRTLDRASQLLASLATQGTRIQDDDDPAPKAAGPGTLAAQFANLRIRHATPTIKVTASRIATMCIAPLTDRFLACAGDKQGTLALCDMTQHVQDPTTSSDVLEQSVQLKPHADAISAIHFTSPTSLVTASYDGSVRVLDVATQRFVLVAKFPRGIHVQALDSRTLDPQVVWYSTDAGGLGVLDMRLPTVSSTAGDASAAALFPRVDQSNVCEKKIGSVSIHPMRPERVLVGSNDTYARVFDVRYAFGAYSTSTLTSNGFDACQERALYKHAYSCTAAYWQPRDGKGMCTTSYDDLVRIWDGDVVDGKVETKDEGQGPLEMKAPTSALRHDNKTGRWVTLLRAKYHPTVQDCVLIGNMQRHIDVIDSSLGRVVATLGDAGLTAVPAVTAVHPTSHAWTNVVVGGNASGKVSVWTPGLDDDGEEEARGQD